jgi:hypothetical protein
MAALPPGKKQIDARAEDHALQSTTHLLRDTKHCGSYFAGKIF